jgi:WD40 repeat protein
VDEFLVDAATGKQLRSFQHGSWVNSVAFSPEGTKVITGSMDGTTKIWDISDLTSTHVGDFMLH